MSWNPVELSGIRDVSKGHFMLYSRHEEESGGLAVGR